MIQKNEYRKVTFQFWAGYTFIINWVPEYNNEPQVNYCQIKMIHAAHHFTPILILSKKNIDIPPITE